MCRHRRNEGAQYGVGGFRSREDFGDVRAEHNHHLALINLPRKPVGTGLAVVEVVVRVQIISRIRLWFWAGSHRQAVASGHPSQLVFQT